MRSRWKDTVIGRQRLICPRGERWLCVLTRLSRSWPRSLSCFCCRLQMEVITAQLYGDTFFWQTRRISAFWKENLARKWNKSSRPVVTVHVWRNVILCNTSKHKHACCFAQSILHTLLTYPLGVALRDKWWPKPQHADAECRARLDRGWKPQTTRPLSW